MKPSESDTTPSTMETLMDLVRILRKECPWDRKQTPVTVITYLIEEVYELLEAITSGDDHAIMDEMGDVMFQLFFLVHLYELNGSFSIADIVRNNHEKMVRRHPHVFGDTQASTPEDIEKNWARIKAGEKEVAARSILDSVPSGLTPLNRAYKISNKAGGAGFDWDDITGVMDKVREEWDELHEAIESGRKDHISLEFGDLMFTLTNIARFAGIHPETALSLSNNKFETRYRSMEKQIASDNKILSELSAEEKDRYWTQAKKDTK